MRVWIGSILSAVLCANVASAVAQTPNQSQPSQVTTPPSASDTDAEETAAGHGSFSIGFYDTYVNGFWLASNLKAPVGGAHTLGSGFDASYNVSDTWTVYGGIRYFSGRYSGPAPNCPTTAPPQCAGIPALNPPHPELPFIDDGKYHGGWQDWNIGVAWHTNIGSYYITPSATAYIPSHDYTTFGNAVLGQDLHQLLFDVALSHQFDFTNFYYRLEYGYAFSEHVLGINTGYQRYDGELGWFINENLSVRAFVTGRAGFGVAARDPDLTNGMTNIYFVEKGRTAQHDYRAWGLGFDYGFANRYTVSANVQREFWGDTVYDFKYALEAHLTRSF